MTTRPTRTKVLAAALARAARVGAFALLALSGCAPDSLIVLVDLRTDYAPGIEVSSVQTDIELDGRSNLRSRRASARVVHGQDIATGARIAEFDRVPVGTHTVIVRLLDARGSEVASRMIRATVTHTSAVVAIITRSCRGVVCPGAGDSADDTECLGGRCVPPECTPETPALCGDPDCEDDTDCPSEGCAVGVCASGACLLQPRDTSCGPGERCHPREGCVEVGDFDGGPADGGVRDGGLRDTGPPPACRVAADCDDGVACTADTCPAGMCVRTPDDASCDDGIACTVDSCGPGGCVSTPDAASCDDGVACTDDSCGAGGCVSTPNHARCDDGVACTDDSCGTTGCVNAPNHARCDDGVGCTTDRCGAGGCANSPRDSDCDDGNPCTSDVCGGAGCTNPNNSNPCDDGIFCNGPDTCGGGSCSVHAGNPCNVAAEEVCSE